ncbi:hypothetical protein GCM10010195_24560 [Kitasatospora griseola]|nr:hypothetical protein GCM10010195_24560 [Kitasatospora griseola]
MATWRNLSIGALRLDGVRNIAAAYAATPATRPAHSTSSDSQDHEADILRLCRGPGLEASPLTTLDFADLKSVTGRREAVSRGLRTGYPFPDPEDWRGAA